MLDSETGPAQHRRRSRRGPWLLILAALLAFIALGIAWLAAVATRRPRPTTDYLALANASATALLESERAWPAYREPLAALQASEKEAMQALSPTGDVAEAVDAWLGKEPGSTPAYRTWVESQRPVLDQVHAAARLPRLGFIIGGADAALPGVPTSSARSPAPLVSASLPHLAGLRSASRALLGDGLVAADEGDWDRASASVAAILGIADQILADGGSLVCQLSALSIVERGSTLATRIAEDPRLSPEGATALLAAVGRMPTPIRLSFANERPYAIDSLQYQYGGDGFGGGRVTADAIDVARAAAEGQLPLLRTVRRDPAVVAALSRPTLLIQLTAPTHAEAQRLVDAEIERLEASARMPRWERSSLQDRGPAPDPIEAVIQPLAMLRDAERLFDAVDAAQLRLDAIRTAVALRFEQVNSAPLRSVASLVPALLETVPLDPFDGAPLRTLLDGDDLVVYSIGPDRADDGGEPCCPDEWVECMDGDDEGAPVYGDLELVRVPRRCNVDSDSKD